MISLKRIGNNDCWYAKLRRVRSSQNRNVSHDYYAYPDKIGSIAGIDRKGWKMEHLIAPSKQLV